jgi:hypothetical protein
MHAAIGKERIKKSIKWAIFSFVQLHATKKYPQHASNYDKDFRIITDSNQVLTFRNELIVLIFMYVICCFQ